MTNYIKNRKERSKDFDKKIHKTKDHKFNPETMERVPHPSIKGTWIERKMPKTQILGRLLRSGSNSEKKAIEMYSSGSSIADIDAMLLDDVECTQDEREVIIETINKVNYG